MPAQVSFQIPLIDAFNNFTVLFFADTFPLQLLLEFGIGGLESLYHFSGTL